MTEAVRPGFLLPIRPREGFRIDVYRDRELHVEVPVLVAAVSGEKLFDVFLSLLNPVGENVDLVLETSHHSDGNAHQDLHREQIERPILMSYFCEFEDLLLNDGCTGVAVVSRSSPMEVQFDEHKLLIAYAADLEPFERVLFQHDILRDDSLRLITEGEHFHSTEDRHLQAFEQFCHRLGIEESVFSSM